MVEQRDGQVAVVAPAHAPASSAAAAARYHVTVTVPTGSALALKTGSADTRAEGEYGATWANTGSGDLVRRAGRPAPSRSQTGTGDVRVVEVARRGPHQERLRRRPGRPRRRRR